MTYLTGDKLGSTVQHGYLQSKPCNMCVTDCLSSIITPFHAGRAVSVAYLDMTEAPKIVSNHRLLSKSKFCGILNPTLSWFTSYPFSRDQVEQENRCFSHPELATSATNQVSVLGSQRFLLHVNEAFSGIRNGVHFLITDDIRIVYSFQPETLNSTDAEITQDLMPLSSWASKWMIMFSARKLRLPLEMH